MTLNTYKIVGISKFSKHIEPDEDRITYICHCVSKDKIATDGYRVTSVFGNADNHVGDEVKIAYIDKRDKIVTVR